MFAEAGRLPWESGALELVKRGDKTWRNGLDFKIDAGDFPSAIAELVSGALAKFGEPDMAGLAELYPCGDEDAINIDAGLALKLEQHVDGAGIAGPAAQNPASATKNGTGEGADEARGLDLGDRLHLQGPGDCGYLDRRRVGHLETSLPALSEATSGA